MIRSSRNALVRPSRVVRFARSASVRICTNARISVDIPDAAGSRMLPGAGLGLLDSAGLFCVGRQVGCFAPSERLHITHVLEHLVRDEGVAGSNPATPTSEPT
jgi:hypothetical protein